MLRALHRRRPEPGKPLLLDAWRSPGPVSSRPSCSGRCCSAEEATGRSGWSARRSARVADLGQKSIKVGPRSSLSPLPGAAEPLIGPKCHL